MPPPIAASNVELFAIADADADVRVNESKI
jgi:hypothetical protein